MDDIDQRGFSAGQLKRCGCMRQEQPYHNPMEEGGMAGYQQNEIDRMPLGMAYVPWQQWKCVYDASKGFQSGTIFPELEMPFCGARCACEAGRERPWR